MHHPTYATMMVADVLAPTWCQAISNHHDDFSVTARYRGSETYWFLCYRRVHPLTRIMPHVGGGVSCGVWGTQKATAGHQTTKHDQGHHKVRGQTTGIWMIVTSIWWYPSAVTYIFIGQMATGPILGLHPANERQRYFVTRSLMIGLAQTWNQPCGYMHKTSITKSNQSYMNWKFGAHIEN